MSNHLMDSLLDEYQNIIGLKFKPPYNLELVNTICAHHRENFAFSTIFFNLDRALSLELTSLFSELVASRAASCYHLNGSMYLILKHLGYDVSLIPTWVRDHRDPAIELPVETHPAIWLKWEGKDYLIDPGWGQLVLPIEDSLGNENALIKQAGDYWILLEKEKPLYRFKYQPVTMAYFQNGLHYHQSEASHFYDTFIHVDYQGPIIVKPQGSDSTPSVIQKLVTENRVGSSSIAYMQLLKGQFRNPNLQSIMK